MPKFGVLNAKPTGEKVEQVDWKRMGIKIQGDPDGVPADINRDYIEAMPSVYIHKSADREYTLGILFPKRRVPPGNA